MGFGAAIREQVAADKSELYAKVTPHDLIHYGLIPELVGRLPVLTALRALDRDAMIRIMTEPKNSVIRQYQELFRMDGVELVRRIRGDKRLAHLKVCSITADVEARAAYREQGFDALLLKPVTMAHLVTMAFITAVMPIVPKPPTAVMAFRMAVNSAMLELPIIPAIMMVAMPIVPKLAIAAMAR